VFSKRLAGIDQTQTHQPIPKATSTAEKK